MALTDRSTRPTDVERKPKEPTWGWGRWLWRTVTSMRTAVILLGLLALAAVPGSLLPQRNVASDPNGVVQFAESNPTMYPWLDRLGMFDVYASAWFAAIYLLLLVSMTGCVIPRSARLWRAVRSAPVPAPRNMSRLEGYRPLARPSPDIPDQSVLEHAAEVLRRRRFRVVIADAEVRAERGYLREVGNLMFHLSLLVLLVGVGVGRLFGFEGRAAIVEGDSFTNVSSSYDAFTPSVWTDVEGLEQFAFTLEDFDVRFEMEGPRAGEPREFDAVLDYTTAEDPSPVSAEVRPNQPLVVEGTKVFLTGHGYAPVVTVRDGEGRVAFSGPAIFLPLDSDFTSQGVVKVPDALPEQLGFEGYFLPTAAVDDRGPYSAFPEALDPQLFLTAFQGDLGMDTGDPQSVYVLDTDGLRQFRTADGTPVAQALSVGESMQLPRGAGTLTFDRVARFANFQIAYDPGKEISLAAAVLLLSGLTCSLLVRRRRVWVRLDEETVVVAGHSLSRFPLRDSDLDEICDELRTAGAAGGAEPTCPPRPKGPQR